MSAIQYKDILLNFLIYDTLIISCQTYDVCPAKLPAIYNTMIDYSFEIIESKHEELDKFLSDGLISYGVAEANGNNPKYIYCGINDANGHIIGGIKGYSMLNMFYISQLFVDQQHRNIGLGQKLLSEIEIFATNDGCKIIRLDTLNKKSYSFYIKAGFEKTTTIIEYMEGFDLLFFHKNIS